MVRRFFDSITDILIIVAFAWLISSYVIINITVPTGSMESTINPKERLLGLRLTYYFSDPQRGDIAVFDYPIDAFVYGKKTKYVKRVIGLPGEKLRISNGKVYINDSKEPLDEPYLKEKWIRGNDDFEFDIPEDCYFLMGDNRNNSDDSRYWMFDAMEESYDISIEDAYSLTFVKRDQFVGKVYFRYWPFTKIGPVS